MSHFSPFLCRAKIFRFREMAELLCAAEATAWVQVPNATLYYSDIISEERGVAHAKVSPFNYE